MAQISQIAFQKNEDFNKITTRRRAVACKSCHSLKVKCIPSDPNEKSSPCIRCIKTKRLCEIDASSNRKKKKSDINRVSELEHQVETLTRQLEQIQKNTNDDKRDTPASNSTADISDMHTFRFVDENEKFGGQNRSSASKKQSDPVERVQKFEDLVDPKELYDSSNAVTQGAEFRSRKLNRPVIDIVFQGLITLEEATFSLKLYHEEFYRYYPFVSVPDDVNVLRKNYPVLFITVMGLMASARPLTEEQLGRFIEIEDIAIQEATYQVLVLGNKTLELLRSLTLISTWYNTPELFHCRRYHFISSLCINIIQDLGFTGRPYYVFNRREGLLNRNNQLDEVFLDENKALVMVNYATSVGYSLFLRRRLPLTWSPYLEETYQSLKNSSDINLRSVAFLGKLTSVMEKIHLFVNSNDFSNYSLMEYFQSQINEIRQDQVTMKENVFLGFTYSIEAFLYSKYLTLPEYTYKCLHACEETIQYFSMLTIHEFKSLPLLVSGRLMSSFALLLKTINHLKLEHIKTEYFKNLFNTMKLCSETYRGNHIILKIRLLFYFYLTTFAKGENVFTSEQSAPSVTPPEHLNINVSKPNIINGTNNVTASNLIPSNANSDDPNHNYLNGGHNVASSSVSAAGAAAVSLSGSTTYDQNSFKFAEPQLSSGVTNNAGGSNELPVPNYNEGESDYPLLDLLSDAMVKGDITSEMNGQEDVWRLFDSKDEQFFL